MPVSPNAHYAVTLFPLSLRPELENLSQDAVSQLFTQSAAQLFPGIVQSFGHAAPPTAVGMELVSHQFLEIAGHWYLSLLIRFPKK